MIFWTGTSMNSWKHFFVPDHKADQVIKLGYEHFIGLRYLRARRKQAMISVVTSISIGGVALGVAALIIVLAVMTGLGK